MNIAKKKISTLFACLLLAAGGAGAEQTIQLSRAAAADAAVDVESLSGSLRVVGWDRPAVEVTGTADDGVEVTLEGDERRLAVSAEPEDGESGGKHRAHLVVHVPAGSRLEVETVEASITVEGVSGTLEASSVSGDIALAGTPRRVEVEGVSGDITFTGSTEEIEAEAVSGNIKLEGVGGAVEVTTVSGQMEIAAGAVRRCDMESVSGGITFTGALAPGGRLEVEAHSGTARLSLPANTSAEWDLTTFSGNIRNAFGPGADGGSGGPGRQVSFSTGSGDGQISVETFSGGIQLDKR